jgi:hypothetical protein
VVVPFFYFAPQPLAGIAGRLTILFKGSQIVSGNISWVNHHTHVLAISKLDDSQLRLAIPIGPPSQVEPTIHQSVLTWAVALLVALLSIRPARNLLSKNQIMNTTYDPCHLVNSYGAFGSITRPRYEIVLEGTTADAPSTTSWQAYEFKGKPGDPRRLPPQIAPYHLRLDWLMWFADHVVRHGVVRAKDVHARVNEILHRRSIAAGAARSPLERLLARGSGC